MDKNIWLYFNTEADDDTMDNSSNAMFPASSLTGMVPTTDGALKLAFKSMRNNVSGQADTISLTLGANNTHLDVMKTILRAINDNHRTKSGFKVVADDLTTVVGGSADASFPKYITDGRQEAGYIAACSGISVAPSRITTITATADGTGTGRLPQNGGGYYVANSTNDDHIIILPGAPSIGTLIYLDTAAETGQAFELRSGNPAAHAINGVVGAAKESVIATNVDMVTCLYTGNNGWLVHQYDNVGNYDHVPVAD